MAKNTQSTRPASSEPQEQNQSNPLPVDKQWLDALIEQKRYTTQLRKELDRLRGEIKEKKEAIIAAEARLLALIEEAGQKYLPFEESTQNDT